MREAFSHLWDTKTFIFTTVAMSAAKWTATLSFGVDLWLAFTIGLVVKIVLWVKEYRQFKRRKAEGTLAPRKKGPFISTALHAALGVTITAYFAAFLTVVGTDPSGQHLDHHAETVFFFAAGTAIATAIVWLCMASWTIRLRGLLIRDFITRQLWRDVEHIAEELHISFHHEED